MFRMPSAALMKSLFIGSSGFRKFTALAREGGEGLPERISWREKIVYGGGLGSELPVYRAARSGLTSKDSSWTPVKPVGLSTLRRQESTACSKYASQLPRIRTSTMIFSNLRDLADVELDSSLEYADETDVFVDVAHKMADAAGDIIRQYFRTKIQIVDKDDLSPVTVADKKAEQAMSVIINEYFPNHGIYGEEGGLQMPVDKADYVWVLDPIDGTKSFITGKPLFGTLIALVHKGVPILGIIDQPILRERWVGAAGKETTLNGNPITTRSSTSALEDAYLYTTSPHLFVGSRVEAFNRVRDKVKTPLYGCDCYAYGLLAAGHVDLVIESGLKPYDFLALVPVIEGAGGYITDWKGQNLRFWPTSEYPSVEGGGVEVAAAGSPGLHKAALAALEWQ